MASVDAVKDLVKSIALARLAVDQEPDLAAFMVRDCEAVKETVWGDLLWVLADGRNYPHRNDVKPVLDDLEAWCQRQLSENG